MNNKSFRNQGNKIRGKDPQQPWRMIRLGKK